MSRHIESISAAKAFARAQKNELRRYPSPKSGSDRLSPLANPMPKPSFRIDKSDTIFAVGSCFARSVEDALIASDINVLSRTYDLGKIGEDADFSPNFFNKYTIHSIHNDLKWALEPDTFPEQDLLYNVPKRNWYADLQLGMAKLKYPRETILDFRQRYLSVLKRIKDANVVIITLGYVETWYDKKLKLYLNTTPPAELIKAEPKRFKFCVLSYEDILSELHAVYKLLTKHRTKPLKMLLTVSPVPLLSTFRDMDVLVANSYSKSVQRAAVDAFIRDTDNVDYFPSYEFVTLSNPAFAWTKGDYRHVSQPLVSRIMENVITQYIGPIAQPVKLENDIALLLQSDDHAAILNAIDANGGLPEDLKPYEMVKIAKAYAEIGNTNAAFAILNDANDNIQHQGGPLEGLILLAIQTQKKKLAKKHLAEHERLYTNRGAFRSKARASMKLS